MAWVACLACGKTEIEIETETEPQPAWQPPSVDLGGEAQVSGARLRPLVWWSEGEPPIRTRRFMDVERDEV